MSACIEIGIDIGVNVNVDVDVDDITVCGGRAGVCRSCGECSECAWSRRGKGVAHRNQFTNTEALGGGLGWRSTFGDGASVLIKDSAIIVMVNRTEALRN